MATLARRTPSSLGDMLDWLESGPDLALRGLTHDIRVEDFVEDDTYVLRAELPGVDPAQDIEVKVTGDVLTITGLRREEEHDKGYSEFSYGSFTRSVPLPAGCEPSAVAATYSDGVLEVRVPIGTTGQSVTKVPVQRTKG